MPISWSVEFYADARGRIPAYEFIESLSPSEHAAALRALDLLAAYGPKLAMPHARHVEGELWELRASAGRLFYFSVVGERFIILHGYRKKTQKAPRREIDMALRRMNEVLGR
jgi:phage-related protein